MFRGADTVYLHLQQLQQVLSEFARDSHSLVKPVTVQLH